MSDESSLLFALSELRQLDRERTERERAAMQEALVERQREAERLARVAQERALAAQEEELAAQEREWQAARQRSENEATHLEQLERQERARALELLSLSQARAEAELARLARARRRPMWLVAVTVALVVGAGALATTAHMQGTTQGALAQDCANEEKLAAERALQGAAARLSALDEKAKKLRQALDEAERRAQDAGVAARRRRPVGRVPAPLSPATPAAPPKIELSRECMDGALAGC